MRKFALPVCLALVAVCPLPAQAQDVAPELVVERPGGKPLIREGQTNRMLLGGTWYFRQDDTFVGETERWFEQRDLVGWSQISIPHNWNGTDAQLNRSSVGWYRKEFTLDASGAGSPKRARHLWKLRFEGANYRTKLWLNGKRIGGVFTGYFPFEVDLAKLRKGRNTLVAKVSSLRSNYDLTHWRPAAFNGFGTGGWWNFGGLLREVYARRVDTIDIEDVQVLPRLRRVRGPARVEVRTLLRNLTRKDTNVELEFTVAGERIRLKPQGVAGNGRRLVTKRFTIKRPKLWQPGSPGLYGLRVRALTDRTPRASYRLSFGVRKLETRPGGVIRLNGKRLNLRGASIHEDDAQEGGALSAATRRQFLNRLKSLGATVTRSHYPLHPAFIEALDRAGIMYWVQAPVYQVPTPHWARAGVRSLAERAVRRTVTDNINHPSIFTWSIANEPAETGSDLGNYSPDLVAFVRDASFAVRELDDTRLVAIDRQSRMGEPYTTLAHQYLDVLGVNEYFGWYRSVAENLPERPASTTQDLGTYLDELHAANPDLPLVITEFGAEASRWGPVEQKGTYEFQRKWVLDHLRVHASKRYVNGSIHWALRDFRVHPSWQGGAPVEWATPPWHNKSLIEETNRRKPAFLAVAKQFRRTKPLR